MLPYLDPSLVRGLLCRDDPHRRGLASSVVTQKAKGLAGVDPKGQITDGDLHTLICDESMNYRYYLGNAMEWRLS